MKCTAAPFFGATSVMVSVKSSGGRKSPARCIGARHRVGLGFRQDDGTVLARSLAVTLSIFDANLNDVRVVGYHIAFGNGEAAIAGFHLDAVIGDAETDGEAKSL